MIYLPAIVTVTTYFEKYRSMATGIAVCGSGLGTFVFAPLTDWLIKQWGWRYAMMVMGVLVFKCFVYGLMFRPLTVTEGGTPAVELHNVDKRGKIVGAGEERPHSVHAIDPPQHANGVTVRVTDEDDVEVVKAALSQPLLMSQTTVEVGGRVRLHSESSSVRSTQSGIMYRKDVLYRGSLHNLPPEQRFVHNEHNINGSNILWIKSLEPKIQLMAQQSNFVCEYIVVITSFYFITWGQLYLDG